MSKECCGADEPLSQSRDDRRALRVESPATIAPRAAHRDECSQVVHDSDEPVHHHDGHDEAEDRTTWWKDRHLLVPILAGLLLAVGYTLEWIGSEIAGTIVLAASLIAGGSTFVPGTIRRLLRRRLGVGLLMTIAAVGAVLLGRVGEAAALAFLFSIAEALEDRAMDRARDGLRALLSLIPDKATISRLSGPVEVPASQIQELDILMVKAGERVATDGVVTSGRSSIDASAITGESIPVEVGPGDAVPAGAINGTGSLQIEATANGSDNSLTTIVRLVEQAQERKGERARLADRIARPLVPTVLIVAALVALFGLLVGDPATWIERALVVLVAASPCALAIAVPVTVISAIGAASRFGVVIKSGEAFEQLGTVQLVAFDKTGTLTRNRPTVVAVVTATTVDRGRVVDVAAALEAHSTHPLAAAILSEMPHPPTAADVVEFPGQGVSGRMDGSVVRVGSPRWITPGTLGSRREAMEAEGMTVVVVEIDGKAAGLIGVRDELKPEAAAAIAQLRELGITAVMLTGDNTLTAKTLASKVGITDYRAEQLPSDKAAAVEGLRKVRRTAMIGDGINDAPALAAADVGISMGAAGSAAAVESADVAFTGIDLRLIPQALLQARRGRRIMTSNILLALGIIIVLFPLALFGVLGLAGVVIVHEIAEVIVILNGIRAARGRAVLPILSDQTQTLRATSA
ncbi:heavy metal-translocating P-type ATPase Cd/Co/Hg/Pb/Zn-transporting [Cnuibacter physcomitrellae]|uniref:Cadmium-translocating P-type ATPase n=1 Tax=Cnuibacter physcomitrellae TaxID=1619308 RepID=A0A1X9LTL1_9MICO|nr:cation-translocating P-type ATPase [Cnuibacter physcomitrellae]ARJ07742.1 cadmium-translocating P-type ATPase [Cnuibacter physcomitrellae]GGI42978.1 heavy metal-translocating P-type ATPase Cd/Co/Hg/Pb/Zn-transporting [Cnuibacter physcomitrellae]